MGEKCDSDTDKISDKEREDDGCKTNCWEPVREF